MKLSVVIPVYRVERWLDRCVESVFRQGYADIEVILVDDGSPDACPALCDAWRERDGRVVVIHKGNGGLSDARNAGIDVAKGECITFVDADDYLADGTLKAVMDDMDAEVDIMEYPVYRFYGSDRQQKLTFEPRRFTDMTQYWLECQAYAHTYAWNKIYRRRLFSDVRFPVGKLFEDVYILPQLLKRARLVATTDKGLYYYCANPEGITATADGRALRMLLEGHAVNPLLMADENYYMHVLNIQMDVYEQTGDEPIIERMKIKNIAKLEPRQRIKAAMLNILGVKYLCKLNKTIHRAMALCR